MRKLLLIMIGWGIIVWAVTMTIHGSWAQSADQVKNALIEWHIRMMILSKERHPVAQMDYQGGRFLSADDCTKALAHPDQQLKTTRQQIGVIVKQQFGPEVTEHWFCAPHMTMSSGKEA